MKLRDLFLEQDDDWGNNIEDDDFVDDQPIHGAPNPADEPDEDPQVAADRVNPPLPADPERAPKPKKLSNKQQIKQKWQNESPNLTDIQMEEAIGFFDARRANLKEYKPFGRANAQGQHHINSPEIVQLVEQFPDMTPVLSNKGTLLDLKNYPWEVMVYWDTFVTEEVALKEDQNVVIGMDLSLERQMEIAKQRWTEPKNQIMNDGNGFVVYKIVSIPESVKLGSPNRILWEKRGGKGVGQVDFWCTIVPENFPNRSNLWHIYRPKNYGMYYMWDQNKQDDDRNYFSCVQTYKNNSEYNHVDLFNKTDTRLTWDDIVSRHPQLQGKQGLLPWYGETVEERGALLVKNVNMIPGHRDYFGTAPNSIKLAYVQSGKHVNSIRAFLTMNDETKLAYVDRSSLENNDIKTRFLCTDEGDNGFGVLDALRLEAKKLYKKLDEHILPNLLGITDGVRAIKKYIIGTNFRRWLTDEKSGNTMITTDRGGAITSQTKFGLVNLEDGEPIKELQYKLSETRSYVQKVEQDGLSRRVFYVYQKYVFTIGDGNPDPNEFFITFTTTDAVKKSSPDYLKAAIFSGPDGESKLQEKIDTNGIIRLPNRPVRR